MNIKDVQYIGSYLSVPLMPQLDLPEYAFIGRSNVGKSSLINFLTQRKNVARTSNTPGKTQQINLFQVNESFAIADLPGYGYARISKTKRKQWKILIRQYLLQRMTMVCAFALIDPNIPPQKLDLDFINWLGEMEIPFVIIFTKSDKSTPAKILEGVDQFRSQLLERWNEMPQYFITSSRKREGLEDILKFIFDTNKSLANYDS